MHCDRVPGDESSLHVESLLVRKKKGYWTERRKKGCWGRLLGALVLGSLVSSNTLKHCHESVEHISFLLHHHHPQPCLASQIKKSNPCQKTDRQSRVVSQEQGPSFPRLSKVYALLIIICYQHHSFLYDTVQIAWGHTQDHLAGA
jgi:hypothetical protein